MIERINLTNLKPCQQAWSDMTPNDRGRVCGKCQKTIIDFRGMSDREIAHYHLFKDRQVCGVYKEEQISAPKMVRPSIQLSKWKSWLMGISGLLASINVSGQGEIDLVRVVQTESDYVQKVPNKSATPKSAIIRNQPLLLKGIIRDEHGEILIGANVIVRETQSGTSSDFEGRYELDLSKHFNGEGKVNVEYLYIGYKTLLKTFHRDSLSQEDVVKMDVVLEVDTTLHVTQFYAIAPKKRRFKNWWRKVFGKKE